MILLIVSCGFISLVSSQVNIPDFEQINNIADQLFGNGNTGQLGNISEQFPNISKGCAEQLEVISQNRDILTKRLTGACYFPCNFCHHISDSSVNLFLHRYRNGTNETQLLCQANVQQLKSNSIHRGVFQEWSCHVLDASAKFPYSGMLYAGRVELGNFDECMSIEYVYEGGRILGKYCLSGLFMPDLENIENIELGHQLATCSPDSCSADDLKQIGNVFYPNVPLIFIDNFCTTIETGKEFSIGSIVMTTILFLVMLLMILSTTYDVYLYKTERECHNILLLAFSVFTNGRKLLSIRDYPKDHIQIFDGIKVISMMWIIAGHASGTFIGGLLTPLNKETVATLHNKRYSGYIDAAHVCVDTFIFLSGFLVAYMYLKSKALSLHTQLRSIPYFYLHRYLRISPAVLMLYLSTLFVLPKIGSGPYWHPTIEQELKPCKEYWWSYILYIQNYVNWEELCLVPHWYLSVDMQMYVLSPLILIPTSLMLSKKNGFSHCMTFLLFLNILFVLMPIIQWIVFPEFENVMATHLRLMDFFIGLMMGVYMRKKKNEPFLSMVNRKNHSKVNLITWTLILIEMSLVLFFYQDAEVNQGQIQRALYFGLSRPAWCIGLCWMIYSCYHGYGGVVNWFLTRPIFQIGAKLSYSMYVLHYTIIAHYTLSNRMKWYFSDYVEFYLWCGYFIETLLWATCWTLAFEFPILVIEKYIFGRDKPKVPLQNGTTGNKVP